LNRRVSVLNNWKHVTPTHVAEAVGELLKEYIDPIRVRLAALEAVAERVTQLESDLEQRSHKGVWDANFTYRKFNTVTHAGCQWTAVSDDNLARPGESQGWLLSVKKGRDGKDARP
jgi:hypothetical protein